MKKLLLAALAAALWCVPNFAQGQNSSLSNPVGGAISVSGANCAVANTCVWQKLPPTATTTTITVTGTFSATLIVETSADGGTTWTQQSSQTAPVVVTFTTTSLTDVRVRCSAFVSGTASVNIQTAGNQINVTTSSGSSAGGGGGVPNSYVVQTTPCGSNANCTQIKGDGKYVQDVTSNSTTTITCPDCAFTSADVGKTEWATTLGTGSGVGQMIYTTYVCPVGTITAVNSATNITVSVACTANATANAVFIWGTKDGAALHALDAKIGCSTVFLPTNTFILVDQSFLITQPTCASAANNLTNSTGLPQPGLVGQGSSTVFIMTPDFNYASCTGVGAVSGQACIGTGLSQIWGFLVWGTGLTSASNANCANGANKVILTGGPVGGAIYFVDLAGICPGTSGMVGVELNTADMQWNEGGAQSIGTTACVTSGVGIITASLDCRNDNVVGGVGLAVLVNSTVNDTGSYPMVVTTNAGVLSARGTHFQTVGTTYAVSVTGTGRHYEDGTFYDGTSAFNGLTMGVNTSVSLKNVRFQSATIAVNNTAGGNFWDGGGNFFSAGAFSGSYNGKSTLLSKVQNTTVGNRNTSLGSTTLLPADASVFPGATAKNLEITLYAFDVTPLGTSCVGNTTILWTISYTDVAGNAKTQSATETITTNGVAGADVLQTSFQIWPAVGTAVTYTTTYTIGGSCSPGPSYAGQLSVN